MIQYALKRLLLIPPTFFLISMVVFMVLNIAPGRPGGAVEQQQGGESLSSSTQKESYLIFKQQFNLDKPILLNLRFRLKTAKVRGWVDEANNLSATFPSKVRIHATDKLDDYGNDTVPHLIALLDDPDPDMRRLAASYLTTAARLRLIQERGNDPEVRAENRVIEAFNLDLRGRAWTRAEADENAAAVIADWKAWWQENEATYVYTPGKALRTAVVETRFAKYWSNLARLDLGRSTVDRRPVLGTILSKVRYSLTLTFTAIVLAYLFAVPIGIFSAARQGTVADSVVTVLLFVMYSLPTFFTGTVLLMLLADSEYLAWFPSGKFQAIDTSDMTTLDRIRDVMWHLVLPVSTYTSVALAALSRYARAGVIDVIRSDYVRTARAKGLSELVVIVKHAARNGMIPILTLLGGLLPLLVSGSVVIEVVFEIPGMGLFLYDSIGQRDYNAVMGVLLISSLLTLFGLFLSDLSYAFVDPRISYD